MIVVESSEIRNMEEMSASYGVPVSTLMERAGKNVADFAEKILKDRDLKNVCILCGTGNNGGDGFVAAEILSGRYNVTVIMADGLPHSLLASNHFSTLPREVSLYDFTEQIEKPVEAVKNADIIIDAVYGIGFKGVFKTNVAEIISLANQNKKAVKIAVDVPSGILCDSGSVISDCFKADYTLSFIRERKKSAHKGNNGTLLAICGSYGMAGAAMLAGEAALRTGVGLLKMAVPRSIYNIAAQRLAESVFLPLEQTQDGKISAREYQRIFFELSNSASAMLIGCGMGVNNDTKQLVSLLIQNSTKPMVIDADGLNCICGNLDVLRLATAPVIITPHPGEMARLIASDVQTIQAYRYDVAKDFAMEYRVTVVLKGAGTIIATPEGKVYVNLTGNNGMAKGGSGDVLAGMMSSLLAQGFSAEKAAVYAVYYHGIAGDKCRDFMSARTMLPSDIIKEIDF